MSERGSGGGGRERRLSPRFSVGLDCEISLPEGERSSNLLFPDEKISARTRDLSATGLGVDAPTIYLGYDCIVDQGRTIQIALDLPSRTITMQATSAHYLRQDSVRSEASYVIGLSIIHMSDDDRAIYNAYLSGLSAE